jgi:hypothetical protein
VLPTGADRLALQRRVTAARGQLHERLGALETRGEQLLGTARRAARTAGWIAFGTAAIGVGALLQAAVSGIRPARPVKPARTSALFALTRTVTVAIAAFVIGVHQKRLQVRSLAEPLLLPPPPRTDRSPTLR